MIWIKRNKKHKNIERSQKRIKRGIMKDNKRNASLEYYGAERPKKSKLPEALSIAFSHFYMYTSMMRS